MDGIDLLLHMGPHETGEVDIQVLIFFECFFLYISIYMNVSLDNLYFLKEIGTVK